MKLTLNVHKKKQEFPAPAPVILKPWEARTPAQLAYYLRTHAEEKFKSGLEDTTAAYVRGEIPVEELEMRVEMLIRSGA